jgi:hypothetical protein
MHAPKAPEALAARAEPLERRDDDFFGGPDDDGFYMAASVDEQADLAARLLGEGGHRAGKLWGQELSGWDAAAVKPFKGLELAGL